MLYVEIFYFALVHVVRAKENYVTHKLPFTSSATMIKWSMSSDRSCKPHNSKHLFAVTLEILARLAQNLLHADIGLQISEYNNTNTTIR